jgi:CrcB protein
VNLTGAFVAGAVTGAGVGSTALLIAVTGFLGGYTTFSTWMVERTYIVTSIVAGLALAAAGYALGSLL